MTSVSPRRNASLFWGAAVLAVLVDVLTKALAHRVLIRYRSIPVLDDVIQLTLVYNPGAAFGLHLGSYSRWIFMAIAALAILVLWRMSRETRVGDRLRPLALGLIAGGAGGNLINRVWSTAGVVDFIDVGLGDTRWPTFNVADIAVSTGAILLCWVLWDEDRRGPEGEAPLVLPGETY